MRAVWVDEGNDADYAKLTANGITAPYYSVRDPRVTRAYLDNVKNRGFTPGLYAVASWYPNASGSGFADVVDALVTSIMGGASPFDYPAVCLDIEVPGLVPFVLATLQRWRKHRPKRVTDLTIEGHKGGVFRPSDAVLISAAVRYLVPQCYNGPMTELWDTYAMTANLTDASFPIGSIRPFYDAAHLPAWWDGYAFTQGRLP